MTSQEIKIIEKKYKNEFIKVINKTDKDLIFALPKYCSCCGNASGMENHIIGVKDYKYKKFENIFFSYGNCIDEIKKDMDLRFNTFFNNISFEHEDLIRLAEYIPVLYGLNVKN
jgi:hypothetical protein